MSQSKPDPLVGRIVDGYRVDELLGRGGMGTVYKATQQSLGRTIALKVLSADLAHDEQFLTRFRREADALSRLSHPNIVTVLERGEVDGRPYLAMEFIDGPSLRQILREGRLPPTEALKITSSVLSALQHAHDKGILHRDIKPENVLLARGNVVKVADFGLSRLLDGPDNTRLTRTNLVLGTYEYMAPEQREHAREADHRADLYATGVVFYEMLTGELPIGRFALPSRARPEECDARIDRIVEKSLEKDPDQRYQDADEMAGAVSGVLERPDGFEAATPAPALRYRPAKFEHHIDNLATIDQVLGTVFYIVGVMSLFGVADFPFLWGRGLGFISMFVMGWYLRETGEELRKYKLSARTSQAVISILAGFTLILLPFTFYSFWVLFGHRGRTYFDARNRGLSEKDAASHTYEVVESDVATPPPAPRRAPPPAAASPRPSQIPVQSMVVSEARRVARRGWPKLSNLTWFGLLPIALAFATGIYRLENGGTGVDDDIVYGFFAIGMIVMGLGTLVALFAGRWRRAIAALVLMTVFTAFAFAFEHEDTRMRSIRHTLAESTSYIGQVRGFAVDGPNETSLTAEQRNWVRKVTGQDDATLGQVSLRRSGNYVMCSVHPALAHHNPEIARKLRIAVEVAYLRSYPTWIRRTSRQPDGGPTEYFRAKFESAPAPWDDEPARVWIGTFRRAPRADLPMPEEEIVPLSGEQRAWLAEVSGFDAPERARLVAEGGLVHLTLPKRDFYRENEAAWRLVLAAQALLPECCPDRQVSTRALQSYDLGLWGREWQAFQATIQKNPPPPSR